MDLYVGFRETSYEEIASYDRQLASFIHFITELAVLLHFNG